MLESAVLPLPYRSLAGVHSAVTNAISLHTCTCARSEPRSIEKLEELFFVFMKLFPGAQSTFKWLTCSSKGPLLVLCTLPCRVPTVTSPLVSTDYRWWALAPCVLVGTGTRRSLARAKNMWLIHPNPPPGPHEPPYRNNGKRQIFPSNCIPAHLIHTHTFSNARKPDNPAGDNYSSFDSYLRSRGKINHGFGSSSRGRQAVRLSVVEPIPRGKFFPSLPNPFAQHSMTKTTNTKDKKSPQPTSC